MTFKLPILVLALATLFTLNVKGQTPTVPPQAAAVGFNNLVFDDEFTNANTFASSNNPTATSKWYRYGSAKPNDIAINTGAGSGPTAGATGYLTVDNSPNSFNAVIQSVPGNAVGSQRTGAFQHGYFEARMQYSSTVQGKGSSSAGWPSFWLWDTRALSPVAGQLTAECDILEAWPLGNAGAGVYPINTLHNWKNTASDAGTDVSNTDSENAVITPAPPTDNGWHTWGCLWVQTSSTTGYVQFYLDNVLIVHQGGVSRFATGAGTGLSAMETAYMYIILGTAQNWPMNVDWVHVWQSGTGTGTGTGTSTAQTVSNFPSTLSLSTAESPYTLPATTSAGLALSYSVASGPATVSGHTLTLTGAGTVVVNASQAGNSTYAPFSATETITVTAPAQAPALTLTQTVSNFPSTLSLSTAASPYTLPATTSAGLTIAYSVASGPATVSGNILTLTSAGTVVVNASQAGNSTYASFSATETITATAATTVTTVPPQAAAVGFNNLVFDDEFTNANTFTSSSTPTATSKWYRYGNAESNDIAINAGAGTGATAGATGYLTVNNSPDSFNAVIQSVPGNAVGSQRTGTFQHGYFEARIQYSSTVQGSGGTSSGWPSFWLWDARALSPVAGQLTAECDILEAWPLGNAGAGVYPTNTLHNWQNSNSAAAVTDTYNTDSENEIMKPAPPTDNGWHTYGCLWVQTSSTTGYVEFYLDNVLIAHQGGVTRFLTGAGTGLSAMETAYMYVILGTAQNWPMNVDWVHVWQGTAGTTAQTVSNFPSTLSLSTASSPYTLPATTSAGLTLSYSVASGPATVSGNTLTLTGGGTVVLNASQGGNSTYAPFSATETITVTGSAGTQTVSNFPSTLSLSTGTSSYSLPATTSDGLTITYSVASGPATVSGDKLTITGPGTVVLHASQAGNANYSAFSATETITVASSAQPVAQTVSSFPSTLSLSTAASPYTLPATTSAGLTLTYSVASGPATVSGHTLTITGAGTIVLHANQAGNANYSAFSATETITVTAPAVTQQTVSNFPSTLSLSTAASPYTLPATTSAGLTIAYSVASGPATVSGNILTLTGTGTVVVNASQAGNANYAPFSATETITVTGSNGTTQTVSSFPSTLGLTTTAFPYSLPVTTSAGMTITYSVVSGTANLSGNVINYRGTGTIVVHASQAGNATYAPFSATETISVVKQ